MILFGIDPGKTGGLATKDTSTKLVQWFDFFVDDKEWDFEALHDFFKALATKECFGIVEEQQMYVWNKNLQSAGGCMFCFGMLKAFLVVYGIPHRTVLPSYWKPILLAGRGGVKAPKKESTLKAREIYPTLAKQLPIGKDGRADALLLLKLCEMENSHETNADRDIKEDGELIPIPGNPGRARDHHTHTVDDGPVYPGTGAARRTRTIVCTDPFCPDADPFHPMVKADAKHPAPGPAGAKVKRSRARKNDKAKPSDSGAESQHAASGQDSSVGLPEIEDGYTEPESPALSEFRRRRAEAILQSIGASEAPGE